MVEEHGAEMSSRDRRDARRVNAAFEFPEVSSNSNRRRGGGPGGGGGGGGDPPLQPTPRSNLASDNRRSRFGAHLTTEGDTPGSSGRDTPSPPPPSMDPVTAEY
jgi:E3 ubiquitin-protein ligase ZNF598